MAKEKDEARVHLWMAKCWVVVVVALVAVCLTSQTRAESESGQGNSNNNATNSTGGQGNETSSDTDTVLNQDGTQDGTHSTENGTVSNQNGTMTTENGTVSDQNGSKVNENGTVAGQNGTQSTEDGTALNQNGTTTAENGTTSDQNGESTAQNGTVSNQNGTQSAESGTESSQNGTQTAESGTESSQNGTLPAVNGTGVENGTDSGNGTNSATDSSADNNGTSANGTETVAPGTNVTDSSDSLRTEGDLCQNDTCVHGVCNVTAGGNVSCTCTDGWTGDTCNEDIDECTQDGSDVCPDTNDNCVNSNGSFECHCNQGYERVTPNSNCTDIDECTQDGSDVCPDTNDNCINNNGSFECHCNQGYERVTPDSNCTDVDECGMGVCENSDYCENQLGTYKCHCKSGWKGVNCTEDVDECSEDGSTVCPDANDNCVNSNGSFECRCRQGYERVTPDSNCTEQVILSYNNSKTTREFGDDEVFGPFYIPNGFLLNGQPVNAYFVSINGYITFNTKFSSPTMPDINSPRLTPLAFLAPYWADIHIPQNSATSGLYHVQLSLEDTFADNETKTLFNEYNASAGFASDFEPVFIAVITWVNVLPYKAEDFENMQPATFQVVLATDGLSLKGRINWRTVWPRQDDLRVTSRLHLTSQGTQDLMPFTDIPLKKTFSSSDEVRDSKTAQCVTWKNTKGKQLPRGPAGVACPCSLTQARRDLVFQVDEESKCATSRVFDQKEMKQKCCYSSSTGMLATEPNAAKPPVLKSAEAEAAVQEGLKKCFGASSTPLTYAIFQELFPVDTCSRYAAPAAALLWGDPHLVTLDGNQYSFNGLGEYVILRTPSTQERQLEVQGRTAKLENFNVTVFKAFAFKYPNTSVFEIHHSGSAQLKMYVSGQEQGFQTAGDNSSGRVSFTDPANDSASVEIVFSPAITVKITATSDRLSLALSSPLDALKDSLGLLGLVDGDITNDFRLRNGTTLSAAAGGLTPEQLFQFGQSWLIEESESLFRYNLTGEGDNFTSFRNPDFVPTLVPDTVAELLSELNKTDKMAVGTELCGDNVACLQDLLVTGNNDTATQTKGVQDVMQETHGILDRKPPQFIGLPPVWNVTLTSSVFRQDISVTAEASNETLYPDVSVTVLSASLTLNYTFVSSVPGTWQFVWNLEEQVRNLSTLTFTFTAQSSVTNMTSAYTPTVVLCSCVALEQCDYFVSSKSIKHTEGTGTAMFYRADCQCGDAKGGAFCEDDVNVCDACFNSSNCNADVTEGSVCTQCPMGYQGDGIKCYEIDECLQENTCDHVCVNTVGSYTCSCHPGYTLIDGHTCKDVDECLGQTVNCQDTQFCVNTVGGYQCVCRPGYGGDSCQEKVTHVYGGKLVFLALADKGQGWSPDLLQIHTETFKTLADKVQSAISKLLSKEQIDTVGVTVIKFELLQSGRRRRSTSGAGNQKIKATFQVSTNSSKSVTSLKDALTSGFDTDCSGDLCRFGADLSDAGGVLYGVSKSESSFEDNYNLCDSDRNNVCHDASTTCASANGTASCMCRPGYQPWSLYDNACQDIDECLLNTTQELCGLSSTNSTVCHNTVGSYFCSCPKTHRWDADTMKCQEMTGTCKKDNPCKNGAECVDTLDNAGYACRCTDGWSGLDCGSEDEEARKMKTILIAVGAGLGALCLLLLIALFTICLVRSRRKGKDRHSLYELSGSIPRPSLKRAESGPDMQRQDSMHKYTDFRRSDNDVDGGHVSHNDDQLQHYTNPVFTRDDEEEVNRM